MKFLFSMIMALAIGLIATGASGGEDEAGKINPHVFGSLQGCSYCHTDDIPNLSFDPVSTCTKCHEGNIGNHPVARHPIGKKTRIPIPALLPVTDEDKMVCYTCHEPHNRTRHEKMLRMSYHSLCAVCHQGY